MILIFGFFFLFFMAIIIHKKIENRQGKGHMVTE